MRCLLVVASVALSGAFVSRAPSFSRHTDASVSVQRTYAAPVMKLAELQEEVQLLRAELVRKDAIIKSLLSTIETTAVTTDDGSSSKSSTPLQDLCLISKEVCSAASRSHRRPSFAICDRTGPRKPHIQRPSDLACVSD
jgi:hypothetical protein